MGDLTNNFSAHEFECRCGECDRLANMHPNFMEKLQKAREIAGLGFNPTSGYRCPKHPESLKRPTSAHTIGRAVDIAPITSRIRFIVMASLIQAGFNRLGIGENFIHVEDDPSKDTDVSWHYY